MLHSFIYLMLIFGMIDLNSEALDDPRGNYNYVDIDFKRHPGERCRRECKKGDYKLCYFQFELEYYQAMGRACGNCSKGNESDCDHPQCIVGDGFEKGVLSINRMIPGPAIQVCKYDVIVVDVKNEAEGSAAGIHWHGLDMIGENFMDGVPFLTQCPIPFSTTFRYQFRAAKEGTLFYHSHSGFQRTNGQYGVLTIREPIAEDPLKPYYDFDLPEHHILISDWLHYHAEFIFPGLPTRHAQYPESVLINGRGTFVNSSTRVRERAPPTPIFYVNSGKRYRFRVIDASSFACPFQVQVQSHKLVIVASDGHELIPRTFDTLVINAGESYDFVLHTNQKFGDYWVRVRGLGVCESESLTEAFALLRYGNKNTKNRPRPSMPSYDSPYPVGSFLNYPNVTCIGESKTSCITGMQSIYSTEKLRSANPDFKFWLNFNNYPITEDLAFQPPDPNYFRFRNLNGSDLDAAAVNGISLIFPNVPPSTQPLDVDRSEFCNKDYKPARCAGKPFCFCTHVLYVPLNSTVEMILFDDTDTPIQINHPFHLHGHKFMITDLVQPDRGHRLSVSKARKMYATGNFPRDTLNPRPPVKDTASIPSAGYAIIRFLANNPGYWLFHCHYEWHLSIGMGFIVQVGNDSEMPPAPKDFPKCGNYLPNYRKY